MRRMPLRRLTVPVLCALLLFSLVGCADTTPAPEPSDSSVVVLPPPDTSGDDAPVDAGDTGTTTGKPTTGTPTTGTTTAATGNGSTVSNSTTKPAGTTRPSTGSSVTNPDDHVHPVTDIFDAIPARLKGKTIRFVNWGESNDPEYRKVIEAFTAKTGIKVEGIICDQTNYATNAAKHVTSGSTLDLLVCKNTMPQLLPAVQALPEIFDINDGFWDPRISEESRIGYKRYFVNSYNSPFPAGYAVYYNKTIYNNNGLTSPEDYLDRGQWTYENLLQCMKDAVEWGYKGGYVNHVVLPEQMGVSLINYDASAYRFTGAVDNETFRRGFLFGSSLNDQDLDATYSDLITGKSGICLESVEGLLRGSPMKNATLSQIGVVPLPTSYQGQSLSYAPTAYRAYGIGKYAIHPEAVYYFLRYYLDLNKYEPAGANIFLNPLLEKFYRATHLPLMKSSPLIYEHYRGALDSIGKSWGGAEWTAVRHAISGQVAAEWEKVKRYVDEAAASYSLLMDSVTKSPLLGR